MNKATFLPQDLHPVLIHAVQAGPPHALQYLDDILDIAKADAVADAVDAAGAGLDVVPGQELGAGEEDGQQHAGFDRVADGDARDEAHDLRGELREDGAVGGRGAVEEDEGGEAVGFGEGDEVYLRGEVEAGDGFADSEVFLDVPLGDAVLEGEKGHVAFDGVDGEALDEADLADFEEQ